MVKRKCPVRAYLLFLLIVVIDRQISSYKLIYKRCYTLSRLSFMCNKIAARAKNSPQNYEISIKSATVLYVSNLSGLIVRWVGGGRGAI